MHTLNAILLLACSALAYEVTFPTTDSTWTSQGPNTLSWIRVDTDPRSFGVVLVNQNRTLEPVNDQSLVEVVDGTAGPIVVTAAQGEPFPLGSGYQVNLMSLDQTNQILAQSGYFAIVQGSGDMSTSSSASSVSSLATSVAAGSMMPTPTTLTITATDTSTPSDATSLPQPSSNTAPTDGVRLSAAGYLGLFGLIGLIVV